MRSLNFLPGRAATSGRSRPSPAIFPIRWRVRGTGVVCGPAAGVAVAARSGPRLGIAGHDDRAGVRAAGRCSASAWIAGWKTSPWMTLVGAFLGFAAGMIHVRAARGFSLQPETGGRERTRSPSTARASRPGMTNFTRLATAGSRRRHRRPPVDQFNLAEREQTWRTRPQPPEPRNRSPDDRDPVVVLRRSNWTIRLPEHPGLPDHPVHGDGADRRGPRSCWS